MSKFYKRNYVDVLQVITPSYYKGEDSKQAENITDIATKILLKDFELIKNNNLYVQCISTGSSLSSLLSHDSGLGYASSLPEYLVRSNNLTEVTPSEFELNIMNKLGYKLADYSTKEDFSGFLANTLLPKIACGDNALENNVHGEFPGKLGADNLESHRYLLESLGLLHILNYTRSAVSLDYRKLLVTLYTDKIFAGKPITLTDAINVLKEGLWNTGKVNLLGIFPDEFLSGTGTGSALTYTSGTQPLEKMKTWNQILYTSSYAQEDDTYIRDAVYDYFINDISPTATIQNGPLYRFQKAMGFLMSDINDQIVSLETLYSIEDCPIYLLPYLADLIGWTFYTSNTDAWRRQLRDALTLYHQKGTRKGLENLLKTILPSLNLDFDQSFNEFNESYVPNLLYYLLKTNATQTSSLDVWTQEKALIFSEGERDPSNLDNSIRIIVDHLLLKAVKQYPHLFTVRGFNFDLNNPNFKFHYRGREFPIPPWEEEKFYKDCAMSEELAEFFYNELVCLGVSQDYALKTQNYMLENSVSGTQDPIFYNNGFLLLTSGLKLPPNYEEIMANYERDKFDLIPLWNAKSSHYNLTVSSTGVEDSLFADGAFDRDDFFASLEAIPAFTPAKAIDRIHVDLRIGDPHLTYTKIGPRVRYTFLHSNPASGTVAGFSNSGLDMRSSKAALVGSSMLPDFDFANAKSRNNHQVLPTFKRNRLTFGRTLDSLNTNGEDVDLGVSGETRFTLSSSPFTLSGDYIEFTGRAAKRRRSYSKVLHEGDWYRRTGLVPPVFLNLKVDGAGNQLFNYMPLGFIPSSFEFVKVTDYFDLPAVYEYCENLESSSTINGVATSGTFPTRGGPDVAMGVIETEAGGVFTGSKFMHKYRYRDDFEDMPRVLHELTDHGIRIQANKYLELNKHLFLFNDLWKNHYESIYNKLWEEFDNKLEDYDNFALGKHTRRSGGSLKGLSYMYLNDFSNCLDRDLSYSLIESHTDGGDNILSKIYGPYMWNGLLTVDGSSIGQVLESGQAVNNKIKDLDDQYEFLILSSGPDFQTVTSDSELPIGGSEKRNPYFFSGVELVDRSTSPNKMFVYDLSTNEELLEDDSPLIDDNLLGLKVTENGTRLRFSFDYGDAVRFNPEHELSVNVSSLFLKENSFQSGGRSFGIWIHTKPEYDSHGNHVFWTYTPKGKWEKTNVSQVTASTGFAFVRDNLAHIKSHEVGTIDRIVDCFSRSSKRESLLSIDNSDFVHDVVVFNTKNQPIKLDLAYYQAHRQLHREDQQYVIEIIPFADSDSSKYYIFEGMSVIDETVRERSSVRNSFSLDDYSRETKDNLSQIKFIKPDNTVVPLGELISIDSSGHLYHDGDRLTAEIGYSNDLVPLATPKLYSTVNAVIISKIFQNGNTRPEKGFIGVFKQTSYDKEYSISDLKITGNVRGSYIKKSYNIDSLLDKDILLEILKFFYDISQDEKSRNNAISESIHGIDGGNRFNYRVHLAYQQAWGPTAAAQQLGRYNSVNIIN